MKNSKLKISAFILMFPFAIGFGQEKKDSISTKTNTTIGDNLKKVKPPKENNQETMMLNASSANSGPRSINIGLPSIGTTILENDLPVTYYAWPDLSFKSWRMDASTNGVKLLDLGQTAINIGDIGVSLGTYDNLGTDNFQGKVNLTGNHFGSYTTDFNLSGPIKNGFKYSIGGYINMDKGTYSANKNGIDRYYNEEGQLFKFAITKDYKYTSGVGSISILYKYANSASMTLGQFAPFVYHKDGSVTELDGFKIGGDNYYIGQKYMLRDAFTGKYVNRDAMDDYNTESHTLDLIGKNSFSNGWKLNYTVRARASKPGIFFNIMTGIDTRNSGSKYVYADSGEEYLGNAQGALILASKKTPVKSLTSLVEIQKKFRNHDLKIGFNEWLYNVDKFATESSIYYQTVQADPKKLIQVGAPVNQYGDMPAGYEYHNGTENKTALFITDQWDINEAITLNAGARFEYQTLRGDYIDNTDTGNVNLDQGYVTTTKKTDIKKDWLNKAFTINGVYKITGKFGALADVNYNEQAGHLENYSQGNNPHLKQSKILGAGAGVFYNHKLFSLVSKVTYITRDEYRATVNFVHPTTPGLVQRALVNYDVETIGWTTDVVSNPFKNFNLHLLFTLQTPQYKNYSGNVFNTNYSFDNNIVTGVSKVLAEIDPSYQWNKLRFWASARYFSKQYANLTNSLYFKGRWETFAGVNFTLNKSVEFNVNAVNLLNQRGAQGSISGTDLMTKEQAEQMIGNNGVILSGTYIRPFTVEMGMKIKF